LELEERYLKLRSFELNTNLRATAPKHSAETKAKMSADRQGENNPNFGKPMSDAQKATLSKGMIGNTNKPSLTVTVKDILTGVITVYPSIRKAATALKSDIKTLWRREENGVTKPYRDRYEITINRGEVEL